MSKSARPPVNPAMSRRDASQPAADLRLDLAGVGLTVYVVEDPLHDR